MAEKFITIKTSKGDHVVHAEVFGVWAVHESWDKFDEYSLTHVPTGLNVPPKYTKNISREALAEVAQKLGDSFADVDPANGIAVKQMGTTIKRLLGVTP